MLKIDLHLHTVASGHAHNTILEYINRAVELKMKMIGFTEHGPALSGAILDDLYFQALPRIPKVVKGVRILKGIEANILKEGSLDVSDAVLGRLDYVVANIHFSSTYVDKGIKKNTAVMINAIKSGRINILSHPFVEQVPIKVEKVCEAACRHDVLLEVNLHYISERKLNAKSLENLKTMIRVAVKCNKKLIVNSDSHNIWEMADDTSLKRIQKEIGLKNSMIINNYPKELMQLLKIDQ